MKIPCRARYQPLSDFQPRVDKNGQKHCLNCDKPLTGRRWRYCSDKCGFEFWAKHNWSTLRLKMLEKSDLTCAMCGFHLEKVKGEQWLWECVAPPSDDRIYYRYNDASYLFIVDHIIPIYAGGPEFDEENLQVLCRKCNKKKTADDMKKYHQFVKGYGSRKITEFCV